MEEYKTFLEHNNRIPIEFKIGTANEPLMLSMAGSSSTQEEGENSIKHVLVGLNNLTDLLHVCSTCGDAIDRTSIQMTTIGCNLRVEWRCSCPKAQVWNSQRTLTRVPSELIATAL